MSERPIWWENVLCKCRRCGGEHRDYWHGVSPPLTSRGKEVPVNQECNGCFRKRVGPDGWKRYQEAMKRAIP